MMVIDKCVENGWPAGAAENEMSVYRHVKQYNTVGPLS